ncbi:GAF and ANTAR domain-containing protein [Blastococcus goldschmidtiae]|uniref:GAF and ANTAR domain-containing protein n=1 Tax=Blastococcus goldschmidtiae TaxID=3075546 RepID=A0ABU2K579_9ACTN|nr:GAF and ANTAR domain-containing protein [Blastococcus sp. DSM 46792]MDT0275350.1 GAF and ANTAR domain-containing protein [Blastococcus sp. DSM 46792]
MNTPDAGAPDAVAVQSALADLGRISLAEHSLESVVRTVTELTARVLPEAPIASVTVLRGAQPTTVAASGELALDLDHEQYRLGSGPCLSAAATGRPSEIADTRQDRQWPDFAAIAAEAGCDSMLSVPLPVHEQVSGALNVYARKLTAADQRTWDLLSRFAAYAVVPVSNAYLYAAAVQRAEHLEAALDTRGVIDQAKGILMERFKLTPEAAFQALTRVSMETNTKVRDVAARFVATGELLAD